MNATAKWKEIRLPGAVSASIATLLGLCFLVYGVGRGLTRLSFDLPFAFRPDAKPTGVVIVYMDEQSHEALKQKYFAGWDRRVHAALLAQLKAYAVKAVAFDILFDDTTTNDAALIEAAQAHGKVVFGARYTPFGVGEMSLSEPKLPFEELRQAAFWGVAEMADEDGVVRQHYRVARHSTNLLSLAWRTAELSGVNPLPDVFAPRYLNYYGPPGTIPWLSYVQVLSNTVPLSALSNRVVFVGARVITGFSGGNATDVHPTPFSRWTGAKAAGVEINAAAYLNLARGDSLTRPSPVNEFLLVIGVGVLFSFALMLFRPIAVIAIAVSATVLTFVIACVLVWQQHVWFSWAIPGAVQIPCAAFCAVLFRTHKLFREKAALAERLARTPTHSAVSPLIRQQLRERLNTPSPEAAIGARPTGNAMSHLPSIPDCTLLRRIGLGAYGEVWLGANVIGGFRAVKVVYRHNFSEDRPYEREFEGIRHFDPISRNHPGLVHLLHVGRNDHHGYFFYLMELADDANASEPVGEKDRRNRSFAHSLPHPLTPETYRPRTLKSELERRGRLDVKECLQLGLGLTDALDYLHRQDLIHRDIKPSNIIFVEGKAKLADIGLVTHIGEGRTFVGTEGFSPPEGPGSPAGDIYSLGKVLYEALTGLSREHFPDLPQGIEQVEDFDRWKRLNRVVLRACEHSLRKRYPSAKAMQEDLRQLTASRTRRWDLLRRNASAPRQP